MYRLKYAVMMWAEFEIEIGGGAPVLVVPYAGYADLIAAPHSVQAIPEARDTALESALLQLNSGVLMTAKCDLWTTTELNQEEEELGCDHKHASYIDILFRDITARSNFEVCEQTMRDWTHALRPLPPDNAMISFVLRACEVFEIAGYFWTVYVSGFGETTQHARQKWEQALKTTCSVLSTSEN